MDDKSYQLTVLKDQIQNITAQLAEIKEVLKEIENVDYCYTLISTVMVKKSKVEVRNQLNEKKELLELKLESLKNYINKLQPQK